MDAAANSLELILRGAAIGALIATAFGLWRGGKGHSARLSDHSPFTSAGAFNFEYRIIRTTRGARPAWAPRRVFDDGRRTWIEFDDDTEAADLPPLFVITPEGAELTNYRIDGRRYMIDRVFDAAELRLARHAEP